jgi:hypothetical protein
MNATLLFGTSNMDDYEYTGLSKTKDLASWKTCVGVFYGRVDLRLRPRLV